MITRKFWMTHVAPFVAHIIFLFHSTAVDTDTVWFISGFLGVHWVFRCIWSIFHNFYNDMFSIFTWILLWPCKVDLWMNFFWQKSHMYSFSLVWILWWGQSLNPYPLWFSFLCGFSDFSSSLGRRHLNIQTFRVNSFLAILPIIHLYSVKNIL